MDVLRKLYFLGGSIAVGFAIYSILTEDQRRAESVCETQKDYEALVLKGRITDVYISKNHANHTIVVNNVLLNFAFDGDVSGLYGSVMVGDSIVKESGTMATVIIRGENVSSFNVDFGSCKKR